MELPPITWAGLAAILSAIAGILAAYAAVVRAKRETKATADEDCLKKLMEVREHAMKMSDELYNRKRSHIGTSEMEEIDRTLSDW